ncbi:MAG: M15 family metallopeptidase [Chloroflexota bacterium]
MDKLFLGLIRFGIGTLLLTACNTTSEVTQPISTATITAAFSTLSSEATADSTATEAPTEIPPPPINIYNMYIGKDDVRQPAILESPPETIVNITELDSYEGSHVQIFLAGLNVSGHPIEGWQEMLEQLILLMDEARQSGFVGHTIYSSYRSYEDQIFLTGRGEIDYLQDTGQFLAEPGRSEHQLGTGVDLGWGASLLDPYITYNNEAAGDYYQWLKANAHRFGFVLSYPFKSNEAGTTSNLFEAWITEYKAETWHIRYVGLSLAMQIFEFQDEQRRNYLDPYSSIIPQQFYLP